MSTLEEVPLQAADSKEEEDGSLTTHTESLEPDNSAQISTVKEAGAPVTRSRWMTIFTTVTTLIAYAFLNAGISMIAPFYPFVVSHIIFLFLGTSSLIPRSSSHCPVFDRLFCILQAIKNWTIGCLLSGVPL